MRATMMRRSGVSARSQLDADFGRTPAALIEGCAWRMRGSLAGTLLKEAQSWQIPFALRQVEQMG